MTLVQSARFFVPTMTCPSCKRRIAAALGALEGVFEVEVHIPQKEVVVRHDILTVSRDDPAEALSQAHYPGYLIEQANAAAV